MSEPVAVRAPVENVNDETIAIVKWMVENGERVEQDTPLLLAETTKTQFDVVSPSAGFVWKVAGDSGEVPTGTLLCYVGNDIEAVKRAAAKERPADRPVEEVARLDDRPTTGNVPARFSKKALALIKSLGMDPAAFSGTGLVREEHVLEAARTREPAATENKEDRNAAETPTAPSRPAAGIATRVEKLSRSKRLEAQFLRAASGGTIPSLATVAVPTAGFFTKSNSLPDLAGFASSAVIFEVSRLLRVYPVFNAYHDAGMVHYYEDVNVGYAIDLGQGLKVPVIQHADRKSLQDISTEKQARLVEYISNTLPVAALTGGTFTITDLSGDGVVHFNPLLNQGQSAILGVCAEALFDGASRGTFNLVLGFDHQLAEGRTAAAFLRELRDRLIGHEQSLTREAGEATENGNEPRCMACGRSVSEIQTSHQFLVRTIVDRSGAEGHVCSVCVQGW